MFGRKIRKAGRPGAGRHPDFPPLSEVSYLDVLSAVEAGRGVERYLEIGSRTGDSVARVHCSYAAVDPEFRIRADVFNAAPQMMFFQQTSDEFFGSKVLEKMGWVPDLAFIDGMHLFEFALRDFMNAEAIMAPGGMICLHDICPYDYAMTDPDPKLLEHAVGWTGDVWKTIMVLLDARPDLKVEIVAARKTGLACISNLDPDNRVLADDYQTLVARYRDLHLRDIGASGYYGRFELIEPGAFMAALTPSPQ